MSGPASVATQISLCVRYVAGVLRDVQAMLSVAEAVLAQRGHHPLRGGKFAVDVSTSFKEPEGWLAHTIWRSYGKLHAPSSLEPLDEVRIVEVHLAPSFAEEPMLVLAKAALREPQTRREVWDAWKDGVGDVLTPGVGIDSTFELPAGAAARVLGIASAISARVSPLQSVADEPAVLHRLVEPLLTL